MPAPLAIRPPRRTVAVQGAAHLGAHGGLTPEQHHRVDVALQGHLVAHAGAGTAQVGGPVQPYDIGATGGDAFQPLPTTLGEHDAGDALACMLSLEAFHHAARVGQAEGLEGTVGQDTAPAVKDHHRLCTGLNLRVEVGRDGPCIDLQDLVHQVRAAVHQALHVAVVVAARTFDHVAGQGPGAAGKPDQGDAAAPIGQGQGLADGSHRVKHVAQLVQVGHLQRGHIGLFTHRLGKARPLARRKAQPQAHGVGHRQDVREQNSRVQRIAVQGLQRHLGGEVGAGGQTHEAAGPRARGVVFGQVAAGLAHQPHRGVVGGLAQAGAQELVVGVGRWAHGLLSSPRIIDCSAVFARVDTPD